MSICLVSISLFIMKYILLVLSCCFTLCQNQLFAATQINTPTVSGVWTIQGSPYYVHNDVIVSPNTMLTIQPGVEVIFMGHYLINVQGQISAVGTPEAKITFKANDTTGWANNALPTAGGWKGLRVMNYINTDPSIPTFAYCIFRDIKYTYLDGGLNVHMPMLYINQCEFFHNNAAQLISLNYMYSNQVSGKLKFSNCSIHDNRTGKLMTTFYGDSALILKNKFYNNTTDYPSPGIYNRISFHDTSTDVLVFKENELYDNVVTSDGSVVNCLQGGITIMEQNIIHHNQTEFKAAVGIQSKRAFVNRNLIVNNTQRVAEGTLCAINDGGGGIQFLGQLVFGDIPGQNEYTASNNIIANNYSSVTGAGVWAQNCKLDIINNTIINNTVKDGTGRAAIFGMGMYSKYKIQNNIIHNNKQNAQPSDTTFNNFKFAGLELMISNNFIDYYPTDVTGSITGLPIVQGLNTNIYNHNLSLVAAPAGIGPNFNALNANFAPAPSETNCINRGNNTVSGYGTADFHGLSRVFDQQIDLGAIEYQKTMTDTSTAIKGMDISSRVKLYPNPSSGRLQLQYDYNKFDLQEIAVYTMSGQLAYRLPLARGTQSIDISMLADGIYMVQLLADQQAFALKKLIIQR